MSLVQWLLLAVGVFLVAHAAFVIALVAAGRRTKARALAGFIPDCIVLLRRLMLDPRLPRHGSLPRDGASARVDGRDGQRRRDELRATAAGCRQVRGFAVRAAIMDKGYDNGPLHNGCRDRGVFPITPLRKTPAVVRGEHKPPCCEHGEWTFAGADRKRRATKWRCPTGKCKPASVWVKASRLHPLLPRESKRSKALYSSRGAVEREFGRLKHEWALAPLRTRGLARADLRILAKLTRTLTRDREVVALEA